MSSRFVTGALATVFGGFVVVMSRSFHPGVVGWLGFAFGIGVIVMSLLSQMDSARGMLQRVLDGGMVVLGALAMAFGLSAAGGAERWLIFAFALGWVGLGLAGLTAHEVAQWRASNGLAKLHMFPSVDARERRSERRHAEAADGRTAEPAPTYDHPQVA